MDFKKLVGDKKTNRKSRTENKKQDKSKYIMVGVVIVIVVVLIFVGSYFSKEHMSDVFYLDQIGMKNMDPTNYKYTGRDKDVLGMSAKDYYLENGRYASSHAAPQLFLNNNRFKNQTDYLGMPEIYRPSSLSSVKNLTE